MEKMPATKKESGVSRIIGVEPKAEAEILEFFKAQFEKKRKDGTEKEHPLELDKLVHFINFRMKNFVKKYGGEAISLPPENIHIIDPEKLTPEQTEILHKNFERTGGMYIPEWQLVGLLLDYSEGSKLAFTQTLVHEMLHINSFLSFQKLGKEHAEKAYKITKETETGEKEEMPLGLRRMGFRIRSPKGTTFFSNIDEAIITELTMRFDWKYFSKFPQLAREYGKREQVVNIGSKKWGEDRETLRKMTANLKKEKTDGAERYVFMGYSYEKEREELNTLIDDLYQKNKNDFSSREEIFDEFAKAVVTGKLLPVARLIERTYGKRSFRELGKKTGYKQAAT